MANEDLNERNAGLTNLENELKFLFDGAKKTYKLAGSKATTEVKNKYFQAKYAIQFLKDTFKELNIESPAELERKQNLAKAAAEATKKILIKNLKRAKDLPSAIKALDQATGGEVGKIVADLKGNEGSEKINSVFRIIKAKGNEDLVESLATKLLAATDGE